MFTFMKTRSDLKLGYIVLKSRSQGQILEKTCIHSGRYSFDSMLLNLCQNVCHHEKRTNLKVGHVGSKQEVIGSNLVCTLLNA